MNRSVMTKNNEQCFLCGCYGPLEWHHVFGGANRKNSEKYGLVVPLCHRCHNEPPDGVHFNRRKMDELRARGQRAFESISSHDEFMKIFGENYIDEDPEH